MRATLAPELRDAAYADEAAAIVRSCVHCGFCNATCPTYQLTGDELEGPRGRIYLIKSLLEEGAATTEARDHLDQCLVCRNCETTCPSGVRYGTLLELVRPRVLDEAPLSWHTRVLRRALVIAVPVAWRFALLVGIFSGGVSSIVIAAPLAALWKEREPKQKKRIARERKRQVAIAGGSDVVDLDVLERAEAALGQEFGDDPDPAGLLGEPEVSEIEPPPGAQEEREPEDEPEVADEPEVEADPTAEVEPEIADEPGVEVESEIAEEPVVEVEPEIADEPEVETVAGEANGGDPGDGTQDDAAASSGKKRPRGGGKRPRRHTQVQRKRRR